MDGEVFLHHGPEHRKFVTKYQIDKEIYDTEGKKSLLELEREWKCVLCVCIVKMGRILFCAQKSNDSIVDLLLRCYKFIFLLFFTVFFLLFFIRSFVLSFFCSQFSLGWYDVSFCSDSFFPQTHLTFWVFPFDFRLALPSHFHHFSFGHVFHRIIFNVHRLIQTEWRESMERKILYDVQCSTFSA